MRESIHQAVRARASGLRTTLALGLLLPLACREEPDGEVASRYLDVTLPGDVEVCGGTLEGYDRFIEAVATRWSSDVEGWRARVHVVSPEKPTQDCIAEASCAFPERQEASVIRTASGEHELVHLITGASESAFFTEGIAAYWGSRPFSNWTVPPDRVVPFVESRSSTELLGASNTSYQGAAGFTKLLVEAFGVEQYRVFFDAVPRGASYEEVARVFEDVFGEPMEPFVTRLSEEPTCNEPLWACEDAVPTTLPIVQDGALDCGDPDVQGFDSDDLTLHAPKQALVFTLDEDLDVEIRARNVDVVMASCGDCRPETIQLPDVSDEIVFTQRLTAGTWTTRISNRDHEDMYFGVRVLE